jgi:hypothetical protein
VYDELDALVRSDHADLDRPAGAVAPMIMVRSSSSKTRIGCR